MAQQRFAGWWRGVRVLTAGFVALLVVATFILFGLAAGAGTWLGIPALAAAAAVALPAALSVIVFQHAGWLERNDERHLIKDEG